MDDFEKLMYIALQNINFVRVESCVYFLYHLLYPQFLTYCLHVEGAQQMFAD